MIDHGLTVLECFISDFVSYGYSFNGFSLLLLIVQCSYIVVLLNWTLYTMRSISEFPAEKNLRLPPLRYSHAPTQLSKAT